MAPDKIAQRTEELVALQVGQLVLALAKLRAEHEALQATQAPPPETPRDPQE